MSNIERHKAHTQIGGKQAGGQFKARERGIAAPPPTGAVRNWGTVGNLGEGSRTPWGEAQHVEHRGDGIAIVSTAGHGGIKLSRERNALVDPVFRNSNGWYEEDCEQHIACYTFPDELAYGEGAEYTRAAAERGLKEWYPDQWEQATGEKVTAEESRTVAEREWRAAHAGLPIAEGAQTSETNPDLVVVSARTDPRDKNSEADYLVPREEYKLRSNLGFAVDPSRHPKLPPAETMPWHRQPKTAVTHDLSDALDNLYQNITYAQAKKIDADMSQRWQSRDSHNVRSLQQIIAEEGVVERQTYFDHTGKATYAVIGQNSSSYRISKATFDFLGSHVPDGTSEHEAHLAAADRAQARGDKALANAWSGAELQKARAVQQKAQEDAARFRELAQQARVRERAEFEAMYGTAEEREAYRKAHQVQRERAAQLTE